MTIRTRLAVQFLGAASLVLGGAFIVVYVLTADYRKEQFMGRLHGRGAATAKLLIQVDEVDEQLLTKIEDDNPVRLPEEAIAVYDQDGREIFHLGAKTGPLPMDELERVRKVGELRDAVGERERVAFVFAAGEERFVVVVSGMDIYGRSKLRNQGRVMLVTFLIGQVLIFFIGRSFAKRSLAPLQRLAQDIEAISSTSLAQRVRTGSDHDELAQLARSFNTLLDELQTSFQTQKNFIANASHEMRTPLTAISGQLEVLTFKERSPEEYGTMIRSVLDDMRSLNRLADRLLLMAQAENKALVSTFVPVRLDEVCWQARADVQRSGPDRSVVIDMDGVEDEADVLVNGNEDLLRSLVVNLCENACKYSTDHQAVIRFRRIGHDLALEFADAGMGIAPEDHDRIFEPFYRVTNTGGARGHGIGLSLVRRIAELHGGRVRVESAPGQGARFTVQLPAAH